MSVEIIADPWSRTVSLLELFSNAHLNQERVHRIKKAGDTYIARRDSRRYESYGIADVQITDRPSHITATLTWCDSTSCRYGDQIWRLMIAKRRGICAISGEVIYRGDRIYRPIVSSLKPVNAAAMILACHIESAKKK